jgi:hypothetical protein
VVQVHHVTASREGLEGKRTAAGVIITRHAVFAALPSTDALWRVISICYSDQVLQVPILDTGPWFTDDAYWQHNPPRPKAMTHQGEMVGDLKCNGAGIDLSDGLIRRMGVDPDVWGLRKVIWWGLS